MEQKKLDRINALARKAKTPEGLTAAEKDEQKILRQEYINSYKANLIAQLENTYVIESDGTKRKLGRKQ